LHGFSGPLGLKLGFWGQNRGRGGAILTPNELVLTFRGSYVCANFGENRSRNATVRVSTDGQTHTQTQTDFIICPMLYAIYAIAMGQIMSSSTDQIQFVTEQLPFCAWIWSGFCTISSNPLLDLAVCFAALTATSVLSVFMVRSDLVSGEMFINFRLCSVVV